MDQLKEILRQAIKYRFWIAVGLSAILPLTAYFVGRSAVQAKAAAEASKIEGADKKVKAFASPTVPTASYKGVVAEKTDELGKDVDTTWKKLYARQAPLLTWPDRVADRFMKWGRKWPDKEVADASAVQIAINDYINVYPQFVTEVYKTCRPFNPEDGTGIVSAPPEAQLLAPSQFTIEAPPALGKIWAAQERLWIQRTLLEVVAEVNKNAKNWDTAVIKQINEIDVGGPTAQDQRSLVNGETLEEAPAINDPSKPEEATEEASAGASGGGSSDSMSAYMSQGRKGMAGMMGMGAGAAVSGTISYIKNDSTQFKILPVKMTVLLEQDKIQDFLVALENSPMTIQVMDFEMSRPEQRVTKPEKGASMAAMGYGGRTGGYGGMMGGYEGAMAGGMTGMGGMYNRGRMSGGMGGGMMEGGGYPGMGGGGYPGMAGGGGTAKAGVDKRQTNLAKEMENRIKAAKKAGGTTLHDPYYNVVQVTVYGQARFFNPPPEETATEPSQAGEAVPSEDGKKDAAGEKTETDATPKPDAEKAEGAPKAGDPKEEVPKADAPKAEPKKDEGPKPEASAAKVEAPKAGTPPAQK